MDETTSNALASDLVIDITTRGRSSGEPKRIEIWIHELEGRYYITGSPGTRSWYANLLKDPSLTIHLKKSHLSDLPAVAKTITDVDEKRRILRATTTLRNSVTDETIEDWLARSPLVEITFP